MKKKIAFLTSYDPLMSSSWSGTPKSFYNALIGLGYDVEIIGPVKNYTKYILRVLSKVLNTFFGVKYNYNHSILVSLEYSVRIKAKLNKNFSFIFAPGSSTEIAFLKTDIPIVYASDATFNSMLDYYEEYSSLTGISKYEGNTIEQRALNKSTFITYPTEWARYSAIKDYRVPRDKISLIQWGANFNESDVIFREKILDLKTPIRLLFLGVDWKRKGGEKVLEITRTLLSRGINAELNLCGVDIDLEENWLKKFGRLDKNDQTEYEQFLNVLQGSDLLVLPTTAECYGMVFCETAAYGIPSVTYATGGIPSVVTDETGLLLPLGSTPEMFADAICEMLSDKECFNRKSTAARRRYIELLNWKSWANKFQDDIEKKILQS